MTDLYHVWKLNLMEENMKDQSRELPDHTAARTALWRALHVQEEFFSLQKFKPEP